MVDLGMTFVDNWVVGKEKGCYRLSGGRKVQELGFAKGEGGGRILLFFVSQLRRVFIKTRSEFNYI